MKDEIYVHIGYPKTGTKFLQQSVFPRVQGLNYIPPWHVRQELSLVVRQNEFNFDYAAVKASLEKHFKPGRNLLSNESLMGDFYIHKLLNSRLVADRLAGLFPGAKIIITIRNQYDLMESLYRQYLHKGGTKRFREFVSFSNGSFKVNYSEWEFGVNIEMFDYVKVVDYYEKLFGISNILIIPYELLRKNPRLFIDQLFFWMGFQEEISYQSDPLNSGYGSRQAVIARFLNRFLRSKMNEGAIVPDICLPVTGKIDAGKLRVILQSKLSQKVLGRKFASDEMLKTEVKKVFADSNRLLDARYGLSLAESFPGCYF